MKYLQTYNESLRDKMTGISVDKYKELLSNMDIDEKIKSTTKYNLENSISKEELTDYIRKVKVETLLHIEKTKKSLIEYLEISFNLNHTEAMNMVDYGEKVESRYPQIYILLIYHFMKKYGFNATDARSIIDFPNEEDGFFKDEIEEKIKNGDKLFNLLKSEIDKKMKLKTEITFEDIAEKFMKTDEAQYQLEEYGIVQ